MLAPPIILTLLHPWQRRLLGANRTSARIYVGGVKGDANQDQTKYSTYFSHLYSLDKTRHTHLLHPCQIRPWQSVSRYVIHGTWSFQRGTTWDRVGRLGGSTYWNIKEKMQMQITIVTLRNLQLFWIWVFLWQNVLGHLKMSLFSNSNFPANLA